MSTVVNGLDEIIALAGADLATPAGRRSPRTG